MATRQKLKKKQPGKRVGASILNVKLAKQVCRYVKMGLPTDACCDLLGIAPTTWYLWRAKGEKYINGDGEPAHYRKYGMFVAMLRKAMAEYRLGLNMKLHGDEGDWVQAMTILERRDRRHFSRNEPQGGDEQEYQPDDRYL